MGAYRCFARRLRTPQGYLLGVGGLCLAGSEAACQEAMGALAELKLADQGIYEVDYALARAIQAHAPLELHIAGATLATGADLPDGVRTGGVLGSPREEIASAEEALEPLPEGLFQCAIPGGPGIVAQAPKEAVTQALEGLRQLGSPSCRGVLGILEQASIPTALVVFDGTGSGAHGCLLALAEGQAAWVDLEQPEGQEVLP